MALSTDHALGRLVRWIHTDTEANLPAVLILLWVFQVVVALLLEEFIQLGIRVLLDVAPNDQHLFSLRVSPGMQTSVPLQVTRQSFETERRWSDMVT